ncbi:hypothetical protein PINS_up010220 [Pythium insidiosum]|nr:hypothetical protein PINS_up010220 [Pythium insidiosum]
MMAPSTLAELVAQMNGDSDSDREQEATILRVAGASSHDPMTDWRHQLRTQQWIDVLDSERQWREAVVEAVHRHKVQVRYRGWERKWDEWISRRSDRLAPAYSRVPPWRERMAVGTPVQVGLTINGFKHPVWRDGHVDAVSESFAAAGAAGGSNEKQRRVRVLVDGERRWLDRSDDMLAPPGTHDVPPKTRASTTSPVSTAKQKPTAARAALARDDECEYRIPGLPRETLKTKPKQKATMAVRGTVQTAGENADNGAGDGGSSSDDEGAPGELLWRAELAEESLLEASDEDRTVWYDARIVETRRNVVRIRFRGWPWRYDEWIKRASDRLAPIGTHLGSWREFQMRAQVQVGILGRRASDTAKEWKIATVVGLRRKVPSKSCVGVKLHVDGESFWRDAHDDFLAPLGHPTYPPCEEEQALAVPEETLSEKENNCVESPPPRKSVPMVLNLASPLLDAEAAISISDEPSSTASTDVATALELSPEADADDNNHHHSDARPTIDGSNGGATGTGGSIAAADALVSAMKEMLERATREIVASVDRSMRTIRESMSSASTSAAASPPTRARKRAPPAHLQTNSKRRSVGSQASASTRSSSSADARLNEDVGHDGNVSLI